MLCQPQSHFEEPGFHWAGMEGVLLHFFSRPHVYGVEGGVALNWHSPGNEELAAESLLSPSLSDQTATIRSCYHTET